MLTSRVDAVQLVLVLPLPAIEILFVSLSAGNEALWEEWSTVGLLSGRGQYGLPDDMAPDCNRSRIPDRGKQLIGCIHSI